MKKRMIPVYKILIMLTTVLAAAGMISTGISVLADSGLRGKGNLVFDKEEISVYASDIDYLQSELDTLFGELP